MGPVTLDFSDVRRRLFPRRTPHWVNNGRCFVWALTVHDENQDKGARLCTVLGWGGHAFVQVGYRFYDAAFPQGVEDWREIWGSDPWPPLGAFERQGRSAFIATWEQRGADLDACHWISRQRQWPRRAGAGARPPPRRPSSALPAPARRSTRRSR